MATRASRARRRASDPLAFNCRGPAQVGAARPQPIGRGHGAAPLWLHRDQAQAAVAGDHDVVLQLAGRQVAEGNIGDTGGQHQQAPAPPGGPGPSQANHPVQFHGGPVPVQKQVRRLDLRGVRRGALLGCGRAQAAGQRAHQHGGAQRGQLAAQLRGGLLWLDLHLLAAVDGTRVEAFVDRHEAHPGDGVARQDGAFDGCRPPPPG